MADEFDGGNNSADSGLSTDMADIGDQPLIRPLDDEAIDLNDLRVRELITSGPYSGPSNVHYSVDDSGGGEHAPDKPAYYKTLQELVVLTGIMLRDEADTTATPVDSRDWIGDKPHNKDAAAYLEALIGDDPGAAHAGLYNNLGCARAWNAAFDRALTALQAAQDCAHDYQDEHGAGARASAVANALVVLRAQAMAH